MQYLPLLEFTKGEKGLPNQFTYTELLSLDSFEHLNEFHLSTIYPFSHIAPQLSSTIKES